jgi:dienelactone hydrolase
MAGSMTEIPVNGDTVPAYVSLPPQGNGPGVVVIQEWWGLVPHIRNVADRLAAQGFVALAPDLYRGKETTEPDEAGKLVMELQLEQAAKDMAAAVDALLAMPETTGEGAGVVGFCVGGGLALFLASRKPEVTAVVCYYGFPREGMQWDLSAVKAAVLGHPAGGHRAHRARVARRRSRRHLPPLPGHHPRLLQRRPARGPRRRCGRDLLAADARVPAPAPRPDLLSACRVRVC